MTWKVTKPNKAARVAAEFSRGHDYKRVDDGTARVKEGRVHQLLSQRVVARPAQTRVSLCDSFNS